MKKFWLILLLVCGVRLLSSCGGGEETLNLQPPIFLLSRRVTPLPGQL